MPPVAAVGAAAGRRRARPRRSRKASGKAPTADDARRAFKGYSSTANATVIAGQAGVALWALSLNQLGGLPTHVVVWAVYQRGGALAAAFLGLPFATLTRWRTWS